MDAIDRVPLEFLGRAFQSVFYNEDQGKGDPFPTLGGHSSGLYDDIDDLVTLRIQELALAASQPESLLAVMPLHLCSQVLWRSL
jgi:hypothetical protein